MSMQGGAMGRKFEDLTGNTYGDVTVIGVVSTSGGAGQHKKWICRCNICNRTFTAESGHLKKFETTKCRSCSNKASSIKHGCCYDRLYGIWRGMIRRCYNDSDKSFPYYGGRGIKVCDEWGGNDYKDIGGYFVFKEWSINHGYSDDLSIDRIDNNNGYYPENCRWVSKLEQNNNTRQNVMININGEIHSAAEWSRISGIKASTIRKRWHNGCRGAGLIQ